MELGEYRESLDIDLLCADIVGYRILAMCKQFGNY